MHYSRAEHSVRVVLKQVLERDASAEVGKADVFVSWALSMSVPNLLDALESFIAQEGRPVGTKFWVCDFVIQQNNVGLDLPHLGACVAATDSTCLMMVFGAYAQSSGVTQEMRP